MKKLVLLLAGVAMLSGTAHADNYVIDKKGMHASIQFKVSHLGYSWLWGRFNDFEGTFSYDPKNPSASKVSVTIDPASVDSNHAERDKHLRSDDFLYVEKYPESKFVSTSYKQNEDGSGVLKGDFTLRGVTRPISIDVQFTGAGKDPWGGYRAGFEGKTSFTMADFGITKDLGPSSKDVELILVVEGIRQ